MAWAIRSLVYLAIACGSVCVLMYSMQRRLLYAPHTDTPSEAYIKAAGLAFWPRADRSFRGYMNASNEKVNAGLVVVFHGNAGAAWHREYYSRMLKTLGYRVLLAEYPGYGGRSGKINERSLVEDAKETVRLAHEWYGGPVYLCGESLGCGVSTGVAADPPVPIQGVVLVTPWDTLPNLAQTIYWFLPARWLVRDQFDNIKNLSGFPGRVAVAVAEYDEVIPKRHGLRFYEALSNKKRLWIIKDAKHNTWPEHLEMVWWQQVMAFLEKDN